MTDFWLTAKPQNISKLWNAHKHALFEVLNNLPDNEKYNNVAIAIRELLSFQGLAQIYDDHAGESTDHAFNVNKLIADELNYSADEKDAGLQNITQRLNARQQAVFDHVTNVVLNGGDQKSCFVDGPGGSGKTILYSAILAYL
ncbi:hypothetical protein O9G_005303 [Rozella allomycis CSF55]|uniref:ATP-dependent DNA helicase n=1 Tax=Rozella allomycis (strain CSF55) TaxID=988480 RepID=A0A075AUY3_ROZAC|nr:hypothetical protein O9G_005303 [Rozella allomycis CSF55]|eukprot:EPZ34068.1 hypothetical protein O9G_005303 [Rozella allomycis CSF55]